MPELGALGSVRGALSNGRPYPDHFFCGSESMCHHDSEVMDGRGIDRGDA